MGEKGVTETQAYVEVNTPRPDDVVKGDALAGDSQPDALKSPEATKHAPQTIRFRELYRFATTFDKFLLLVGVLMAAVNGALYPIMAMIYGDVLLGFTTVPIDTALVDRATIKFACIAVGMFVSDYCSYVAFYVTAERQMKELRSRALRHMLYLDISWYDSHDAQQLSSRITGDTIKIKDGMGQKFGDTFRFLSQFLVGLVVAFVRGWDIALIMAIATPLMTFSLAWLMKSLQQKAEWSQKMYAETGSIAEETLGSIRTVASLNAERHAIAKFKKKTREVETENIALHKTTSFVLAMFMASGWVMYAIGIWYGGWKVSKGNADPAEVFSAFFAVMMATGSFGQISPSLTAVSQAAGAAQEIFKILDTPSSTDASKDEGVVPAFCAGKIELKHVNFAYPSRPNAPILHNYTITIENGHTVAFVGSSGSGKSTLVALLERFYEPSSGDILLDGRNIKTLNLRWLRSQIGLVSQEPVLFATTIFENIAFGDTHVSREQAIEAAKLANAHDFIMSLPEQYDTLVGEKGTSLSGGQKQRIAIARAIVRNPKILVLDEATSALDNESEKVVQTALDDLMAKTKTTTLVIAHRLSTIRRADKIVVMKEGSIVETGTHDSLLAIESGYYHNMYTIQQRHTKEDVDSRQVTAEVSKLQRHSSICTPDTDISADEIENNALKLDKFGFVTLFQLSRPESKVFVAGVIGTALGAFTTPISGLMIGTVISNMTTKFGDYEATQDRSYLHSIYNEVEEYSIAYFVGSVVLVAFLYIQNFCFKYIEEKLASRLRNMNFEGLCRQNIGFFDEKSNGTGALTADLATNATKVALLSGDSQARVFQAIFTLGSTIILAFILGSWVLTLFTLAMAPFVVAGNVARMKQAQGSGAISDDLGVPGAHASEVLSNIRTIASLGIESKSAKIFDTLLLEPMQKGNKEAQINGLALGFNGSIMVVTNAFSFWYGGRLINDGSISFTELMRTLMTVLMAIQFSSTASTFFGDAPKAFKAGATVMAIHKREVPIDSFEEGGVRPSTVMGKLEFRNISFRYPRRPEADILKRFNLTIEAGQTVALCGPSGGGKSTIISLIERFYDPVRGEVLLDGHDLKSLNLNWLRSQIGLVGQEPTLFIGTIAENIAFGLETKPSREEIEAAAAMANAHNFIAQFPDGYETQVGMKGEQLSGGQKQRIAIARAILKNPNILLLDEATSALDSESEKVVQEALDQVVALKKRTTVVIAHRLSTIRRADVICVVKGGIVVEQGSHQELMDLGGIYKDLAESA